MVDICDKRIKESKWLTNGSIEWHCSYLDLPYDPTHGATAGADLLILGAEQTTLHFKLYRLF